MNPLDGNQLTYLPVASGEHDANPLRESLIPHLVVPPASGSLVILAVVVRSAVCMEVWSDGCVDGSAREQPGCRSWSPETRTSVIVI